ncbi:DUF2345 domain-containing protein [Variovorax arabinosiphilus]|uniref:DUF2345 domain-containing protein n=1 Tax=Variovorax arabinosiphilus TaxID=3053498 RepID=UPI002575E469|nr:MULTISPECIES: DUF2345 domain-containing protein [unclassified Variovorax]MDM0121805.1 DUF2345 domain-containing protein [Variovorax sp. J2L1-78]MDM0131665.1 DUF2345 domain-containing protein [Variovorax sp. J2L1-63]MDM0234568.1 DUF2345 domain-containing protein [Variovorax sp. J2R1-6]
MGRTREAIAKVLEAQHDALEGEGQVDLDKAVFPEMSGAHLVLASTAGVAATTSQSVHLQAGEHIAITRVVAVDSIK